MQESGPVFSAYRSGNQAIPTTTWTKVQVNAESFDPDSAFDAATNYRFQPSVAGYYQINGAAGFSSTGVVMACGAAIYKNGALAAPPSYAPLAGAAVMAVSAVVYLNGSTDYVELWAHLNSGGTINILGGADATAISGHLVRAV